MHSGRECGNKGSACLSGKSPVKQVVSRGRAHASFSVFRKQKVTASEKFNPRIFSFTFKGSL